MRESLCSAIEAALQHSLLRAASGAPLLLDLLLGISSSKPGLGLENSTIDPLLLLLSSLLPQVAAEQKRPLTPPLRVVPLFETLADLEAAGPIMTTLFDMPWYRQHVAGVHGDHQEASALRQC